MGVADILMTCSMVRWENGLGREEGEEDKKGKIFNGYYISSNVCADSVRVTSL